MLGLTENFNWENFEDRITKNCSKALDDLRIVITIDDI